MLDEVGFFLLLDVEGGFCFLVIGLLFFEI